MVNSNYNPDVLNCIANLSNDEVFTPPELANRVLDLLPQDLFKSPDTKFLDPFSKSGVFLREIVKRLDRGLESQIPDRQLRIDHILHNQVFGIAITELTSYLSRRSLYCSKHANGKYSVSQFDTESGNILYANRSHTWENGKCKYCGASQAVYDRGSEAEQYAYMFIHTDNPKQFFGNMKFDVIVGNPPYQMEDGGNAASAIPVYNLFVQQAKRLKPRYLTMIIPARWYAGGRGLEQFREEMLNDGRIRRIVDYTDSRDCFEGVNIAGGVCYFLWDRDNKGDCEITNVIGQKVLTNTRSLNEYSVFVRSNAAIDIIRRVRKNHFKSFSSEVYSSNPFGFRTYERGSNKKTSTSVKLITSDGYGYVERSEVKKNTEAIDKYNVIMTRAMSGGNKPGSDGKYLIIPSTIRVMKPGEICAETYLCIGHLDTEAQAQNLISYLCTKVVRFLLLQSLSSIMINKDSFQFVPDEDFSHPWTDEMLIDKFKLSEEEVELIDSLIRPME